MWHADDGVEATGAGDGAADEALRLWPLRAEHPPVL